MDVDRLMKDLTIDQLENIHSSLQLEMESKKEGLRDMVGRRYRDVLEASTEVRHVRQLAETLAEALGQARNTQSFTDTKTVPRNMQHNVQMFIALHRLLPLIGDEDGDALCDAFALLLSENIHKQLASAHLPSVISSVVSTITGRLVRTRRTLISSLEQELGELSNPDWVTNQLIALALIKDVDLEGLLNSYLTARKNFIGKQLEESSSLLSILNHLKSTLAVIDQLFTHGELSRHIQALSSSGYRPALFDSLICDQASSFSSVMVGEIEKLNRSQRERKSSQLLTQKINDKCISWVDSVCALSHETVSVICGFYEKSEDIIEFLQAISTVFRENWPRVITNSTLYQNFFQTALLNKFQALMERDLSNLEQEFLNKLSLISLAPHPLFEKRAGKFDSLLGVGISRGLYDAVTVLFEGVQVIRKHCSQYEKVGLEAELVSLKESFAEGLVSIIERISHHNVNSSDEQACLARARLSLSFLHSEASLLCQCLNKDGDRIQKVNSILHTAIEESLRYIRTEKHF
ncbi:unnamed protein product [Auanema sp. JU1783]|nr:unnamed protein product [Auanema sp. JU1783]